jgi:hypothetical protein
MGYIVYTYSKFGKEQEYSRRDTHKEALQDMEHVAYWWRAGDLGRIKTSKDRIDCTNQYFGSHYAVYIETTNNRGIK